MLDNVNIQEIPLNELCNYLEDSCCPVLELLIKEHKQNI